MSETGRSSGGPKYLHPATWKDPQEMYTRYAIEAGACQIPAFPSESLD